MAERFVEIDARVFLDGIAHVASGFSVNGPQYSAGAEEGNPQKAGYLWHLGGPSQLATTASLPGLVRGGLCC